jgi:hypothetical protein
MKQAILEQIEASNELIRSAHLMEHVRLLQETSELVAEFDNWCDQFHDMIDSLERLIDIKQNLLHQLDDLAAMKETPRTSNNQTKNLGETES